MTRFHSDWMFNDIFGTVFWKLFRFYDSQNTEEMIAVWYRTGFRHENDVEFKHLSKCRSFYPLNLLFVPWTLGAMFIGMECNIATMGNARGQ